MYIGIDVGGTHSDGVLIDAGRLIAAAKVPTQPENLLLSINEVLQALLRGQDSSRVRRINLSTTLTTNAIINKKLAPVAVLVSGGPGIPVENYRIGAQFHRIPGSLNHVGAETLPLDESKLEEAILACKQGGINDFAVAAKFSPRNPEHELRMKQQLQTRAGVVSCGHQLSGQLNFGRRIYTAYYNAAVHSLFQQFIAALNASLHTFKLNGAEVNILKADGGAIPLPRCLELPVQSILSGPAASIMGILATMPLEEDFFMLDMGGTSSDIALFATGQPLLEREGISIDGRPTLVRALRVASIGVGGDSLIHDDGQKICCGPQRLGPCMAMGGEQPTLMDVLNSLGKANFGDVKRSRQGLEALGRQLNYAAPQLAHAALQSALEQINQAMRTLLNQVNSQPLYTIQEILEERTIHPKKLVLIGGPATVFQPLLASFCGLETLSPPLASVTNAMGAALSRTTSHLSISADTSRGKLSAPTLNLFKSIGRDYTLDKAIAEARMLLCADLDKNGVQVTEEEVQVVQADSFNMVESGYMIGKNIRVSVQVRPAVVERITAFDSNTLFTDVRIAE